MSLYGGLCSLSIHSGYMAQCHYCVKTTSQRHFDAMMTLSLRHVSTEQRYFTIRSREIPKSRNLGWEYLSGIESWQARLTGVDKGISTSDLATSILYEIFWRDELIEQKPKNACMATVIWHWRKSFSQRQDGFHLKTALSLGERPVITSNHVCSSDRPLDQNLTDFYRYQFDSGSFSAAYGMYIYWKPRVAMIPTVSSPAAQICRHYENLRCHRCGQN